MKRSQNNLQEKEYAMCLQEMRASMCCSRGEVVSNNIVICTKRSRAMQNTYGYIRRAKCIFQLTMSNLYNYCNDEKNIAKRVAQDIVVIREA
jgi:hypothetical protein